jgi:competence protein ComEA
VGRDKAIALNRFLAAGMARRLGMFSNGGLLFAALLISFARAADVSPQAPNLAQEDRSLKAVCARCHNLQLVMDTPRSYDAWRETVQAMVDRGANGTDDQFDDIMDYLHRTMTTIDVNTADADELQMVLNVPQAVAQAIMARRITRKFVGLADLKSVPGVDASTMDAKARLIFFK